MTFDQNDHSSRPSGPMGGPSISLAMSEKFGSRDKLPAQRNVRGGSGSKVDKLHKNFTECSYSIANLTLIIGSVVVLAVLIKFIQDDPLYEYGEHLLTLRFYRQLIYIIVIVPLVLLVPLGNAASAFFISRQTKEEIGSSVLTVRAIYMVIMLVLVFIALVFVAPSVKASVLSSQIELELRKHMKHRYDNSFSYEFLDRLQAEYECCDELWYRANLFDKLPMSCFVDNNNYDIVYKQTCSDAIGLLVSVRCSIIACCLIVMLIALACLIAIDIFEMFSMSARKYDVTSLERHNSQDDDSSEAAVSRQPLNPNRPYRKPFDEVDDEPSQQLDRRKHQGDHRDDRNDENGDHVNGDSGQPWREVSTERDLSRSYLNPARDTVDNGGRSQQSSSGPNYEQNRLRSNERKQETPLLAQPEPNDDSISLTSVDSRQRANATPSPILTRANYIQVAKTRKQRPQSPAGAGSQPLTFQTYRPYQGTQKSSNYGDTIIPSGGQQKALTQTAPKGVLKKTSSFQRLETTDDDDEENFDSLNDYVEKLRSNSLHRQQRLREQQLKRSLLNVRFADNDEEHDEK